VIGFVVARDLWAAAGAGTMVVTGQESSVNVQRAMAVCTVHHWQDPIAGLREMRRVARRVVVFAGDTSDPGQFWLTRDYLPEFAALRGCRVLASLTGCRAGRRAEGSAQPP
jgi:hypothetical protein